MATAAHPELSRQIERLGCLQAAVEQTFLEHAQTALQVHVLALERRDPLAVGLVLGGESFGKTAGDSVTVTIGSGGAARATGVRSARGAGRRRPSEVRSSISDGAEARPIDRRSQ